MKSRHRFVFRSASRNAGAPVLALALVLTVAAACSPAAQEGGGAGDRRSGTGEGARTPTAAPPAGAIRISEDLYAVPIGPGADGCERYRLWSARHMVVQAIHYRRADGGFTMNKQEAACAATGAGSQEPGRSGPG